MKKNIWKANGPFITYRRGGNRRIVGREVRGNVGGGRIVTQPKSSKPPHPISPRNKKWPVLKVKLRGRSQTAMLMERKLNVVMLGLTKNHMTIPLRKTMHRLMSMTGQHWNKDDNNRIDEELESSLGTIRTTEGDSTTAIKPNCPMKWSCPLYPYKGKLKSLSSTDALTWSCPLFSLRWFVLFPTKYTMVEAWVWHGWQQVDTMFFTMNGNMASDWESRII